MTKGEFEKRIGKLYYFDGRFMRIDDAILKKDAMKLVDEMRKECPIIVTKELVKIYKELVNEVGFENVTGNVKTVLWLWKWLGDKK